MAALAAILQQAGAALAARVPGVLEAWADIQANSSPAMHAVASIAAMGLVLHFCRAREVHSRRKAELKDMQETAAAQQAHPYPGLLRPNEHIVLLYHPRANLGHGLLIARWLPAFLGPRCHSFSLDDGGVEGALAKLSALSASSTEGAVDAATGLLQPALSVRVIVAGGDGSVVRVLSALRGTPHEATPLAVIPLGTGNDMAGLLGWGVEAPDMAALLSRPGITRWLRDLRAAEVVQHDMWNVSFSVQPGSGAITQVRSGAVTTLPQHQVDLPCINYTSLGMDARLVHAVEMHRLGSRFLNRMVYGVAGCVTVATPSVAVTDGIQSWDMQVPTEAGAAKESLTVLPKALGTYHTLMFLNAHSYGGGCPLWELANQLQPSFYDGLTAEGGEWPLPPREASHTVEDDGVLEVLGSSTLAQLGWTAMTHVNFTGGLHQLAKAKGVDLQFVDKFQGDLPLQVDGEAYILKQPKTFTVTLAHKATVLKRRGFQPMQPWLGKLL